MKRRDSKRDLPRRGLPVIVFAVILAVGVPVMGLPVFAEPSDISASEVENTTSEQAAPIQQPQLETHSAEHAVQLPEDPCLPPLYRDWCELGEDNWENGTRQRFTDVTIVIDRSLFRLSIQGIRPDGSSEEIYRTPVGLGDPRAETPRGRYCINHVYCYQDVVFFDPANGPVPDIYKGLFAPLLLCDGSGRCDRWRDLGIHGFDASAHPNPASIRPDTEGPVSGGCIRVPDPCRFKLELVRLVGVGSLKRNERGSYHWLNKPVAVLITGEYPSSGDEVTIAGIVQSGLQHVQNGLKNFFGGFTR